MASNRQLDRARPDDRRTRERMRDQIFHELPIGLMAWCLEDSHGEPVLKPVLSNRKAEESPWGPAADILTRFPDLAHHLQQAIVTGRSNELGRLDCGDEGFDEGILSARVFPLAKNCAGLVIETLDANRKIARAIQRQARLIDLATDAILVVELDGVIACWNMGAERLYGWTSEEAQGRSIAELLQPDSRGWLDPIKEIVVEKGNWEGELTLSRRDGTRIVVSSHWTLERSDKGKAVGWLQIDADISEQKGAEKALRREMEFTDRLINSSVDGIFAFDRECRYTVWNPAMEKMFGMSRSRVMGRRAFDVFPYLTETGEETFFRTTLEGRSALAQDRPYRLLDSGRERFFEARYSPIWDASGGVDGPGTVIGGLAILHDISDRKRAEDSVRSLSARLLRLQDEERRRIARELHDSTAQTLSALALNLASLQRQRKIDRTKSSRLLEESYSLASQAAQEIRNLSHLLHPPDLDSMGLEPAVRWYVARFTERTGIQVEIEIPQTLQRLSSDSELALFRVIQEALSNVHRHSGSPTALIRISQSSDFVALEIRDNGRGMQTHENLATAGHIALPGVGIAGMRERLRQLGGRLEITSNAPSGIALKAFLPIESAK